MSARIVIQFGNPCQTLSWSPEWFQQNLKLLGWGEFLSSNPQVEDFVAITVTKLSSVNYDLLGHAIRDSG